VSRGGSRLGVILSGATTSHSFFFSCSPVAFYLAQCALANPPFMSPKGDIRPRNRFSIKAKRREVLFVDYMAEHLTPNGRAAIIVPEGIIFQSQTDYKELRKMLLENSLVAVVSLPAGCFQPYAGVKTSILILDKSIARQSDTIAFFKVENDGFGNRSRHNGMTKRKKSVRQIHFFHSLQKDEFAERNDGTQAFEITSYCMGWFLSWCFG
jgi:type I restriction-modification system DNA methylase subunit